jgi:predicted alpha/beta hydrolase
METEEIVLICKDGIQIHGDIWTSESASHARTVIINAATGVLARYYHRYARFLAERGFNVLTYDYRGIGRSRPRNLKGCGFRWRDWGELDFDAAIAFARGRFPDAPLLVVGHSIGGFLPGFAEGAVHIERMLTVGAQYAYFRDYEASQRVKMVLKWHLAMPVLTGICGYFPGRRLGWLEDLPAGVAMEWSFRRARMEASYPSHERADILARFAAVRATILAICVSDDDIATPAAVSRALAYYSNSTSSQIQLSPDELGFDTLGHFGLFHARHELGFWRTTAEWLSKPSVTAGLARTGSEAKPSNTG